MLRTLFIVSLERVCNKYKSFSSKSVLAFRVIRQQLGQVFVVTISSMSMKVYAIPSEINEASFLVERIYNSAVDWNSFNQNGPSLLLVRHC